MRFLLLSAVAFAAASPALSNCNVAGIQSPRSSEATQFVFTSSTGTMVDLYWIDFNGNPVLQGSSQNGQRLTVQSFRGHVFYAQDFWGQCVSVFRAEGVVEIISR